MSSGLSVQDIRFIERVTECPLCASKELKPEFSISIYTTLVYWDACLKCDLVFQNPRLAEETIKRIYQSEDYWGKNTGDKTAGYVRYQDQEPIRLVGSRDRLRKIMDMTGLRSGKVLDVGCATGFFAAACKEKGFQVKGIDPSPEMAAFGQKQYGIEIECKILEDAELQAEYYDLITLWGTDSHFLHPLESFQKLIRSLKPGGIFCMTYQNFRHWVRFFFPGIKKSWNALYNLNPKSLQVLFEKLELEILFHDLEWKKTTLGHICRIAKIPMAASFQNCTVIVPAISFPFVIARKNKSTGV